MTRFSRFVIAAAVACLPLLARAEGKCNDDPFVLQDGTLGVAWAIPMVEGPSPDRKQKDTLLSQLDSVFGGEPPGYPYGGPGHYEFPDDPRTDKPQRNSDEVKAWLSSFPNIPFTSEYKTLLDKYFAENRCVTEPGATKTTCHVTGLDCDPQKPKPCAQVVNYGWVVRHPPVENKGKGYSFCSCTLQRAALVFDGTKEELWVRSSFITATSDGKSAHFAPGNPVIFTFETKRAWFPLALNKLLSEPGRPAYLLLDLLTKSQLDLRKVPAGFHAVQMGSPIDYKGTWYVTRITRKFQPGGDVPDLRIEP